MNGFASIIQNLFANSYSGINLVYINFSSRIISTKYWFRFSKFWCEISCENIRILTFVGTICVGNCPIIPNVNLILIQLYVCWYQIENVQYRHCGHTYIHQCCHLAYICIYFSFIVPTQRLFGTLLVFRYSDISPCWNF